MVERMIACDEPPDEGESQAEDGRQVEGGLPAEIHHDPGGDGRGDRGADADAPDRDPDAESAFPCRKPVGDDPIEIRQSHRFADAQ